MGNTRSGFMLSGSDGSCPGVRNLMVINLLAYGMWRLVPELGDRLALLPAVCRHDHSWWRVLTYSCLHYSVLQLTINLGSLWIFGRLLEATWGARRLLTYYAVCGIGSGVFVLLFNPHGPGTVGATGAVTGLIAALSWLYPDASVLLFSVLPLRARRAFIILAAMQYGLCWQGSMWQGRFDLDAHLALLGGVLTGYVYYRYSWLGMIWLHKLSRTLRGQTSRRPALEALGPSSPIQLRPRIEEAVNQHRLDAILDKIARDGMASLTADECQWLQQASRRLREGDGDVVNSDDYR